MKLNLFFKKFSLTKKFVLVKFELIETKCITFSSDQLNILSPCVDLNEHD
jgi:hypothetical protein